MKQIFHKTSRNKSQIYVWKVVSTYDRLFKKSSLCEEELKALEVIKSEKRKIEFLATRQAVKSIFGDNTILKHHNTGQPYIEERHHISISHSKNFVVLAIGDESLGIDIEEPNEKILQVLPRILSKKEHEEFQRNPSTELACKLWGAKEAVLKYVGNPKLNYRDDIRLEEIEPVKVCCDDTKFHVEFENIEHMILTLVTSPPLH